MIVITLITVKHMLFWVLRGKRQIQQRALCNQCYRHHQLPLVEPMATPKLLQHLMVRKLSAIPELNPGSASDNSAESFIKEPSFMGYHGNFQMTGI